MLQISFGNRLKEVRNGKAISQGELANLSGIERTQICRIEQGKVNVTLETVERLSTALQVNVKDLLSFEEKYETHPFVKWAGGKGQLLDRLKEFIPIEYGDYYEPFIGGGALLLSINPKKAYINDVNEELLSVYRTLLSHEETSKMLTELKKHEAEHSEEHYYKVREMDRDPSFSSLPLYVRAARMIYLNKSCFNGLYRVNAKGYFNVPSGNKAKVVTYDEKNMEELEKYFSECDIVITSGDFEKAVSEAKANDFVYFDPPYDVFPDKNGFVDYGKDGFGKEEQARLASVYRKLDEKGVKVMLSNHNTPYINELYAGYNIHVVPARRMINSKADGRGFVEEVIITNC